MNQRAARKQNLQAQALVGRVEDPSHPMVAASPTTPATLVAMAVEKGASIEYLAQLLALQKEWEANEARKAFVEAMVAFKAGEDLQIGKNKHVKFESRGGFTEYDHAELSDCVAVILPALARHGISHAWTFRQDSGGVTVGCVLTHRQGHESKPVEMTAAADDSGGKNKIQAIASTKTYLERYTLLGACGLATGGIALPGPSDDDDGRGAGDERDGDPRGNMPANLTDAEKAERRRLQCLDAAKRHPRSIEVIQREIRLFDESGDTKHLYTVAEAWRELPQIDQMALWLATTKGGVLTTHEREVISTQLPRGEPDESGEGEPHPNAVADALPEDERVAADKVAAKILEFIEAEDVPGAVKYKARAFAPLNSDQRAAVLVLIGHSARSKIEGFEVRKA